MKKLAVVTILLVMAFVLGSSNLAFADKLCCCTICNHNDCSVPLCGGCPGMCYTAMADWRTKLEDSLAKPIDPKNQSKPDGLFQKAEGCEQPKTDKATLNKLKLDLP